MKILSVRAPRGTLVRVTCSGKGCPAKQRRKRIKKRPGPLQDTTSASCARACELEIYVRKPKTIGKYTRYQDPRRQAPDARPTAASGPASKKPRRCPRPDAGSYLHSPRK